MPERKNIEKIAEANGKYPVEAIQFVYEGLTYTVTDYIKKPGHVTGQQLCHGIKDLALKKWGQMALMVLDNWEIRSTRDFGEIVYLMIEHKWMSSQPGDQIEDFDNVYDFPTAFKNAE